MPVTPLFTLRSIARELALPESTVRYYRDAFEAFIPTTGRGRRRRYGADVIPLFRLIAEGYAQNRNRTEIEAALLDATREGDGVGEHGSAGPLVGQLVTSRFDDVGAKQLLATVLDGERERREVMWQMAREIVRLGETIERQQIVLGEIARRVDGAPALLPAGAADGASPAHPPANRPDTAGISAELNALREELAGERQLVERLRKSKLEIERRAALAEAALTDRSGMSR